MVTIDDQRFAGEVDAVGPTVLQAHRAVRVARLSHCRHGRGRPVHRSRRSRRRPVSQYRSAGIADASAVPPTAVTYVWRTRSPGRTVVVATVALGLLLVVFVRVFDPDLNIKALVVGVCLIAVTAAVCLNAFTLDGLARPAGVRCGPSVRTGPGKSAGDFRDSRPDNSKGQR